MKRGVYLKGSYTKPVLLAIIAFVEYFHVAGEKAFSHFSINVSHYLCHILLIYIEIYCYILAKNANFDNIVLAVLSHAVASKFVAVGTWESLWHYIMDIISIQNEIFNLDNICELSDFVDFMHFTFCLIQPHCVCILLLLFYYCCFVRINK